MTLHWTIAALIFLQMGLGWYMNEALPDHSRAQGRVQAIHVFVGLTLLLLVLVRIAWRLLTPPPPLPSGLPRWEAALAHGLHALFYVLMLVLPLSGWLLISVRHEHVALWGVSAPFMPAAPGGAAHKAFAKAVKHFHVFTQIWVALAMIALHVAGALKHQFDGHPVLWRMLPFAREA
jgi:cytochrome b561